MNWGIEDFMAAVLLIGSLIAGLLIIRSMNGKKRIISTFIYVSMFLIIWAELAVGIFD
jgi:hypothetical protein